MARNDEKEFGLSSRQKRDGRSSRSRDIRRPDDRFEIKKAIETVLSVREALPESFVQCRSPTGCMSPGLVESSRRGKVAVPRLFQSSSAAGFNFGN